ncbi:hypothetical protein FRC08_011589 [Ceratobasidium sp. 394]|nr:hypothetical protein FRC08_011589 [Ceratobasidium sp. 394]
MARAEAAQVVHPNATFLDVLVDVLLRIVQSEPKEQLAGQMQVYNSHMHSVALDLVQAIVSRGEVDLPTLETIEATIVSKLYMSVHTDRIDLQNKLLHTLHSTIFAATSTPLPPSGTAPGSPRPAPGRIAPLPGSSVDELSSSDAHPSKVPGSINPLLVQTLTDGISRNAHTPILQHWIDFVLMTIPHFQQSQALVALPLVDCVCRQVQSVLDSIQELIRNRRSNEADHVSTVTDAEVIVLLNALERLVLLSITRTSETGPADEDDATSEKDSGGLFGIVSTVFTSDSNANAVGDRITPLSPTYRSLYESVGDVAANVQSHRAQVFPALQCLVVAAEKQAMTTALDDKRVKKDLQDLMNKLIDACLQISARSIDAPGSRKGTREALVGAANGRASPSPIVRVKTNDASSEKINASPAEDSAKVSAAWEFDMPDEVNLFFARRLIPNFRKFMVENDKVIAVCTNIVYYVVNPAIRAKSKNALDNQPTIMTVMEALVKQQVAVRTWRPALAEAFEDQRFFARDVAAGIRWCPLIKAYVLSDKLAISDIVGRITTTSSNNIFTNREAETLARTISLRRLSFAIFCGETNGCLAQLPSIQEKLVELFRWTSTEPVIHCEIYLCVRVLLCRLSPHNLSSFWPVILTELIRLFTSALVEPPQDNSDELQLLLAACKCVDLMLVLQTPEFQIHQWMFVTDTMDAVYRPDTWIPTSLMDQLAEVIGGLPQSEQNATILPSPPTTIRSALSGNTQNQRRPLLGAVRRVDRLGELLPFFSHVSIALYEGVYSGGNPDTEAIERGLLEEMFTT